MWQDKLKEIIYIIENSNVNEIEVTFWGRKYRVKKKPDTLKPEQLSTVIQSTAPESKSVVSNVHRIHTRGAGYSDDTPKNIDVPTMPDLGSIQGATALKLDNEIQENQNLHLLLLRNQIHSPRLHIYYQPLCQQHPD